MKPPSEPRRFTFYPDSTPQRRSKRPRQTPDSWVAPEHAKIAMSMERDFPRDDLGRKIDGRQRELVVDPRPNIMKPEKPTIRLAL